MIKLLFLLVLLVGCSQFNQLTGNSDVPTMDDFRVGTGSLDYKIEFLESTIPDNSIQDIVFTIDNTGASPIEQGLITISTEEQYVNILGANRQRFEIEGRTPFNPDGDSARLKFTLQTSSLNLQSQRHESLLLATVCYDYLTEFTDVVCINPDPTSDLDEGCAVQDLSSSGQGAPIAVENVRVSMPEEDGLTYPTFAISIANKRDGVVVRRDRANDLCGNNVLGNELNTVSVFASLGEVALECETPIVSLVNNKARIICKDPVGFTNQASYTTPLYVRLGYGYSETLSEKFTIIRE